MCVIGCPSVNLPTLKADGYTSWECMGLEEYQVEVLEEESDFPSHGVGFAAEVDPLSMH